MILPQQLHTYIGSIQTPSTGSTSLPWLSQGKNPSLSGRFPQRQIHASSLPASCVIRSFSMLRILPRNGQRVNLRPLCYRGLILDTNTLHTWYVGVRLAPATDVWLN